MSSSFLSSEIGVPARDGCLKRPGQQLPAGSQGGVCRQGGAIFVSHVDSARLIGVKVEQTVARRPCCQAVCVSGPTVYRATGNILQRVASAQCGLSGGFGLLSERLERFRKMAFRGGIPRETGLYSAECVDCAHFSLLRRLRGGILGQNVPDKQVDAAGDYNDDPNPNQEESGRAARF